MLIEENSLDEESIKTVLKKRDAYEAKLRGFYEEGVRDSSAFPGNAKIAIFSLLGALNCSAKWYHEDGE